jgi:hypothetical protein
VLAAGVVFQLPILVYFLSKVGLVTPDFLKKYRRHSLVIIVTLSAIITPPDIFSQVLVALPLMVLYEISIAISKSIMKQQEAEMETGKRPVKTRKKKATEGPETGKKESAEDAESEKKEESKEESKEDTKDEVSSKKPWKRSASKSESEEEEKPDQEDSDTEDDKTD